LWWCWQRPLNMRDYVEKAAEEEAGDGVAGPPQEPLLYDLSGIVIHQVSRSVSQTRPGPSHIAPGSPSPPLPSRGVSAWPQGSAYSGHYHAYLRDWLREGSWDDAMAIADSQAMAQAQAASSPEHKGQSKLMPIGHRKREPDSLVR
jgi:hypothetical protein